MVIMLDPVSLPVQALSNITLITLNSMVKNMSLWSCFMIFIQELNMNCIISHGIITKGIVWAIFRFVTFGERAERVV